jgi:hypothetical protein
VRGSNCNISLAQRSRRSQRICCLKQSLQDGRLIARLPSDFLQRLYRSRPLFWPVYLCVRCVLCARPTNFLLVLREAELVNRVDQCLETELLKVLSIARIKRIHGVAQQGDSQQRVKGLSWVEPG